MDLFGNSALLIIAREMMMANKLKAIELNAKLSIPELGEEYGFVKEQASRKLPDFEVDEGPIHI